MSREPGPGLRFQTQSMDIHDEGVAVKKMNDSISKTSQKKVGGNRKALQDLSNSGLVYQTQNLDLRKGGSIAKKTSDSISKTSQKKPFQNLLNPGTQNLNIHKEGSAVMRIGDSTSKTSQKKVGVSRKALQDLSNSLSIRQEAARTKNLSRVEHNVAEERFLHNFKQCTAARKAEMDQTIYDDFLFEHGLLHPDTSPLSKEVDVRACGSPQKYLALEPIPELPMSEKADWCPSPIQLDSPPPSASLYELLPELEKSMPSVGETEQNSDIHHKGHAVNLGNLKALQDISNSSSICQEATTENLTDEIPNVWEEGFLHDHNKCIAAQKAQMDHDPYNAILFEHGLLNPAASPEKKETVAVAWDSPLRYLELVEIPELPMPAIADWCPSPIHLNSPPFSPARYELPELMLKAWIDY